MFKRSLILAALAVLAPLAAHAADMAVKAQPNIIGTFGSGYGCVPQSCSGWYAGFGILGDGNNQDVIANGINGTVFSTGGALKVQGGYQLWNGQWFAAIEAGLGYEFTTNASGARSFRATARGSSVPSWSSWATISSRQRPLPTRRLGSRPSSLPCRRTCLPAPRPT
jgi:opacity protein-like surface antigen